MVIDEPIVFLGSGPVAAQSLDFIAQHFTVETVITKAVPTHHKSVAPVETVAAEYKLNVQFASTKKELDQLFSQSVLTSRLGIIIDYGVIVSKTVIDAFPLGIINSHFSLLPEWRGADPITFSILSGQEKTGVSLMVIDEGLDTGKLITQKSLPLDLTETTLTLTDDLIDLSNTLLTNYLPPYVNGNLKPKSQPHPDRATFSRKLSKADSFLSPDTKTADELEREVRAFTGWPKSRITINGHQVIVLQAHVSDQQKTPLDVACRDGAIFSIDQLIAPSGKTMSADAFMRGYAA